MISYEKYMLFIPNRLFADHHEMYVSFNIAVIPVDMTIVSATLHIPLPVRQCSSTLFIHGITTGWDEQYILTTRPPYGVAEQIIHVPSDGDEICTTMESFIVNWRFNSENNHGVYLRFEAPDLITLSAEQPPYLLISTL